MPGTMSMADLVADLKASLNDAADSFKAAADADFIRHLDLAAMDFGRVRARILSSTITLTADEDVYVAPADAIRAHSLQWGKQQKRDLNPWDANWPGALPRISIAGDPGSRTIVLSPAPSPHQVTLLGASCAFRYYAGHSIDADAANTTVKAEDRALLLLRAQAEAAREMALKNMNKPVSMRGTGGRLSGTPSSLFQQLMDLFEAQAVQR